MRIRAAQRRLQVALQRIAPDSSYEIYDAYMRNTHRSLETTKEMVIIFVPHPVNLPGEGTVVTVKQIAKIRAAFNKFHSTPENNTLTEKILLSGAWCTRISFGILDGGERHGRND